ncbi:MAG: hypothetical protein DRO73_04665 [Candidatus Thorarchaeota archaeon]|nr:MAG: hypothetical protein DRO73_04665 [Candidatus Thorarchaeota archaeon]
MSVSLLSSHESVVWSEFHKGHTTSEIAQATRNPNWLHERGLMTEKDLAEALRRIKEIQRRLRRGERDSDRSRMEHELDRVAREWAWSPAYVSRVLNRARKKIDRVLRNHATSHRLDIESVLDYKGLLMGFDYQANAQVYIVFTLDLGVVVWYEHDSYGGKPCSECPKEKACRVTLDTIIREYAITLRPDEVELPMTQQSIAVFRKLAAKEVPRYKRKESD